jgi:hypothetical protein
VRVRSPKRVGTAEGVTLVPQTGNSQVIQITFENSADTYARRTITLPLSRR